MQSQPVELLGIYGSDLQVAESAWYSTTKEVTPDKLERVPALIKMLASEKHTLPFEHNHIEFRIISDVATHIHFLKHRIGVSISSQSQRYMELKEDLYYVPDDWPEDAKSQYREYMDASFDLYHSTIAMLIADGMSRKRAKESARFVLPYATQIRYKVSCNLLSFIHFQKLRNTAAAQVEIRLIAEEMLLLVKESGKFDISLEAWGL